MFAGPGDLLEEDRVLFCSGNGTQINSIGTEASRKGQFTSFLLYIGEVEIFKEIKRM